MDQNTIFMTRGKSGYGFTVSGGRPAVVGRVEPGKTNLLSAITKILPPFSIHLHLREIVAQCF